MSRAITPSKIPEHAVRGVKKLSPVVVAVVTAVVVVAVAVTNFHLLMLSQSFTVCSILMPNLTNPKCKLNGILTN